MSTVSRIPGNRPGPAKAAAGRLTRKTASFFLTFFLMFGLWIVFSGVFEPMFLSLGAVSSLLVAGMYHQFLFPYPRAIYLKFVVVFTAYLFWLLWQVLKANLHIMRLIFHPRLMELIDPHIITFKTPLRNTLSLTTMGNSITLTPGTVTINVDTEGKFQVHSIDRPSSHGLISGPMAQKIKRIFGE
ncbi:MAG: Na+/H+ antiporter subunit E [Desulfonatronovibrionaceae bacterium]